MYSLILELKNEINYHEARISTLLRKVFDLLKKMQNHKKEEWIHSELNGYKKSKVMPEYGIVKDVLERWNPSQSWIHVIIQDKNMDNILKARKLNQNIPELEDLIKEVKIINPLFAMSQEEYYNIQLVG